MTGISSGRSKHQETIPALCPYASGAERAPSGQRKRREMTHTPSEHGQRFPWGKHRATVARAVNSAIAQQLARGSILIPLLGIRVQLRQHGLTILMHVAKEPNPVAKAEEFQAEGASSGVSQRPHAAVPQGLPGEAAAEGDGVKQSLHHGLRPVAGGWGQRGSSGTQLCTMLVFRPL